GRRSLRRGTTATRYPMMTILRVLPTLITAIATAYLAWLTARYTALVAEYTEHSRSMVEEMKQARIAQVRPVLIPTVKPTVHQRAHLYLYARIVNVGLGPALECKLELATEPAWQIWQW